MAMELPREQHAEIATAVADAERALEIDRAVMGVLEKHRSKLLPASTRLRREKAAAVVASLARLTKEELLMLPLKSLPLPARARWLVWSTECPDGTERVRDLCAISKQSLKERHNFGAGTLVELEEILRSLGLSLQP